MASEFIIEVSESDFDYEVLAFSQNTPVIVDFWADWCKPCKSLTPLLVKIAAESQGTFRLATVDVDANPALAVRCGVRSLPTVQAFSQGNLVNSFVGLIPEDRVRDFVAKITPPSPANLMVEKGNSLLSSGEIGEAENAFKEALQINPEYPGAHLGLMKIALLQGRTKEANQLFHDFPASREYNEAEKLQPLIKALMDYGTNTLPEETDLDASFRNCIRLILRGNIFASLDGLLDILRADPHYRKERARLVTLGILELLDPEGEETLTYRKELTSVLFK